MQIKNIIALTQTWGLYFLDVLFPIPCDEIALRAWSTHHLVIYPRSIETRAGITVTGILPYRHPRAKALIHALKYRASTHAATLAATVLADVIQDTLSDEQYFSHGDLVLVPMPLSKERLHMRGFNQVERILETYATRTLPEHVSIDTHTLARIRHTKPQTHLSQKERLSNLSGAFAVIDAPYVHNKHVVLIDDVVTTGASLYEAARALKDAGAKEVTCIAIAYA